MDLQTDNLLCYVQSAEEICYVLVSALPRQTARSYDAVVIDRLILAAKDKKKSADNG